MRTLVTGCAGFIGSHLTEALLADGASVLGVDCFNDNYGRRQKLGNLERAHDWDNFEFVPVDLARGALADLVDGCDVIYHLAAEPGVRSSWGDRFETYLRNNILATQQLLEAIANSTVDGVRLIYASSSSIYGQAESLPTSESAVPQPLSPYGMTKLAAEHLCHTFHANYGVRSTSLRFFSVYGPRQRPDMAFTRFFLKALANEPITVYGDGRQTRDFTFVHDAVDAIRTAAERDATIGNVYNIGGGSQTSLRDAIDVIAELLGHPLTVNAVGPERGDVKDTCADTTRAVRDLDFAPSTPLRDGLIAQYRWAASDALVPAPA